MVDSPTGIGGTGNSGAVTGLREAAIRDNRAARTVAGAGAQGATPNGPRGRRMLSPDTPVDSLDHGAPRGTYLDILV